MSEKAPGKKKKKAVATGDKTLDGPGPPSDSVAATPGPGDGGDVRDDAALKAAVLAAALPDAAFDGFTDAVLAKAGAGAGVTAEDLAQLFPEGPLSLIEYYSVAADAHMEQRLATMNLPGMKIRERIAAAVLARLSVLKSNKEAARRAGATLSLPIHAGLAARLMYRSVDAMWRAVGDTSTDFNFYTKRGILAGVYGATLLRWFNDSSEDETVTTEFLAARIENVMQFEKIKAQAKKAFANFPSFGDFGKPKA